MVGVPKEYLPWSAGFSLLVGREQVVEVMSVTVLPYARFTLPLSLSPADLGHRLAAAQTLLAGRQTQAQNSSAWAFRDLFLPSNYYDMKANGSRFVWQPHNWLWRSIPIIAKGQIQPERIEVRVMCSPAYLAFLGFAFVGVILTLLYQGNLPSLLPFLGLPVVLWYLVIWVTFRVRLSYIKQIFAMLAQGPATGQ